MVYCQAFGCNNSSGKTNGISYHRFPDPSGRSEIFKQWIAALKVEKFQEKNYQLTKNDVICSDHFTEADYQVDMRAKLMGRKALRLLKEDAVPSDFAHRPPPKSRQSTTKRILEIEARQYIQSVLAETSCHHEREVASHSDQSSTSQFTPFEHYNQSVLAETCRPDREEAPHDDDQPSTSQVPPFEHSTHSHPNCDQHEQMTVIDEEEHTPSFPLTDHLPQHSLPPKKHRHGTKRKLSSKKERKGHTCMTSDAATQTCPDDITDNGLREKSTQWPPDYSHINIDHKYAETLLPVLWPCCVQNKEPHFQTSPILTSPPSSPDKSSSSPPSSPDKSSSPPSLPDRSSSSDDSSDYERSSTTDKPSSPTSHDSTGRSSDPSFVPSEEESSSSSDTEDEPQQLRFVKDKKFLVFEECLDTLLYSQKCLKCGSGQICEITKYCVGTMLVVKCMCMCGNTIKWASQPTIGNQPVGNILTASAILLSGKTFEQVRFFAELLNLQLISHTTFNSIQKVVLLPTINFFYEENVSTLQEEVKGRANTVTLCGDGRCDSPGYNAKYCTYSCIDMETNKILDMSLVQVSEATSSVAMEKVGCRRTLDKVLAAGVQVSTMATDRHTGIRKMLREEYANIEHQFDVWHLTKSITKRLTRKSKQKDCGELGAWIKSVTNHIWWAAQNCEKDSNLLIEMIQSMTHHICNIHQWNSCDKFHKCAHRDLSEEEIDARKWLVPGSKAHTALQEVLFDNRLVKDMRQLTQACHTGAIEMYHNLYLKYAPKRLHFKFPAMLGRAQLAVLDHNNNVETKQAVVKSPRRGTAAKGSLRYRYVFSKQTKDWIRKKVQEDKDYTYLWEVMVAVLEMRMGDFLPEEPAIPHLPQNIAPVPRPSLAEIDARATSRFTS